jgi:hypothetical protein
MVNTLALGNFKMQTVTDPALIEKLNKKRGQSDNENNTSQVGAVLDPDVIAKLDAIREQSVKDSDDFQDQGEVKDSAVPRGSIVSRPFQQKMDEILETAGAIASSVGASAVGGLAGLASFAGTGGDFRRAVGDIEQTQQALSYAPRSQGAQENLEALGEFFAPFSAAVETASKYFQDKTLKFTGSPDLAGVAAAIPVAALELIGIKGVSLAPRAARRFTDADVRKAQRAMLLDPELRYDQSVATVKLDSKGRLIKDKVGQTLVDNDIIPEDVAVITNSSRATRSQMRQILGIFEQGKGNRVASMFNRTTRPIGTALTNRLSSLQSKRRALGKRLEGIVQGDLGKTEVDITESLAGIGAILQEVGVMPTVITKNGKRQIELADNWEKGTKFELSGFGPAKKNIEDIIGVFNQQTDLGATTLKQAHEAKKILDELIDSSSLTEGGISQQMQRTIAAMRKSINDSLRSVDQYGAVNSELSDVISIMAPFSRYLQPGQRFVDAKVADIVGVALQGLSGTSASSARLAQDLSALESGLRRMGMSFGDDPLALIRFREILNENFNIDPKIPEYQMGQKVGSLVASTAIGNKFGAAHSVADLASAGIKKADAKKIAEKNKRAFNLMKMALQQGAQ